jgi:membrane-bound lytic murein transglycosylase A
VVRRRVCLLALALATLGWSLPAAAGSSRLLLLTPQASPVSPEASASAPPAAAAPSDASPTGEPAPPLATAPADGTPPADAPVAASPLVAPPIEPSLSGFPFVYPGAWLERASFVALPGWAEDRQDLSFRTFLVSCPPILRATRPPGTAQPVWFALRDICPRALALGPDIGLEAARSFFETEFRPVRIGKFADSPETNGFLTGYYEPEVEASRERTDAFTTAFLSRPEDLVPGRGSASGGFDARGGAGRWVNGQFLPYFDRGDIENGALDGKGLEIAWVRDPTDLLFTQIQGSARLRFADGSTQRIGYAAHNGHRYVPVGRVMIERGFGTREQMSMDFIRQWMAENPEPATDVRRQNRSYVFFRVKTELRPEDGPIGGQGVSITDWRSIAIDRNVHAYGTPVYIDTILPTGPAESGEPFRRLMIAQDTGSAIVGPARGDLFLGTGFEAGSVAGRIRHRADWFVLLPKALSPDAAEVPVPEPRLPPHRSQP